MLSLCMLVSPQQQVCSATSQDSACSQAPAKVRDGEDGVTNVLVLAAG